MAGPAADAARVDRVLGAGTAAFLALLEPDVDPGAQDPAAVRAVLSQPGARRELRETAVRHRDRVDALLALLDDDDAAVLLARAVQAAAVGDTDREVELVRRGLAADPDCRLLALHAAELADDAGDAAAAVALYRRAGLDPYSSSVPLQVGLYARPLDVDVGRNAPCPCGSGRKYKACCWRRDADWPMTLRANWVVDKLLRAAQSDPAYEDVLARRRVAVGLDRDDGGAGVDDEVLALFLEHCVLFDRIAPGSGDRIAPGSGDRIAPGSGDRIAPGSGDRIAPGSGDRIAPGSGDTFVGTVARRRAGVYPADELALALSWATADDPVGPRLVHVDDTSDGNVVLRTVAAWSAEARRDPAPGADPVHVVDPAVAAAVDAGRHLLVLTVPVDDAVRIVGPVLLVPPAVVDAVADADDADDALRRLLAD